MPSSVAFVAGPAAPGLHGGVRLRAGAAGEVLLVEEGLAIDPFATYPAEPVLEVELGGARFRAPMGWLLPPGDPLRLALGPGRWSAPAPWSTRAAPEVAALRAHPGRFDGRLLSLRALRPDPGGGWAGEVQAASYCEARGVEALLDRGGLRPAEAGGGRLPGVGQSALALDIGVVVILELSDGSVVAQRRSPRVDWRAGALSASASGSLEPGPDLPRGAVDPPGLLHAACRELHEELGVPPGALRGVALAGALRELARGGKPELYVIARSALSEAELRAAARRARDAHEADGLRVLPAPSSPRAARDQLEALAPEADPALLAGLLLVAVARGQGARRGGAAAAAPGYPQRPPEAP
jgi:8-oxo-dGTP pyrophosphatase MutT (NUDIX family)